MQFLKLGMTAIASGVLATLAISTPALAQPKPPQLTKSVAGPLNEAQKASVAKDWATAKTKLDAAASQAKTPQDKVAIDKVRVYMQSETKDHAGLAATLESLLASGLITPEETKQYRGVLAKAYGDAGDQPKSIAAFRTYLNAYGGNQEQYIALSADAVKSKDYANALADAKKAIEVATAAGQTPTDTAYLLQMRVHKDQNDMAKYYAVEEELVLVHPKVDYWKELIGFRVQDSPNYGGPVRLDLFRAMQAAGVPLTVDEKRRAVDEAMKRGLPAEALALLEPAIAAGELGSNPDDQDNLKKAKAQIGTDKANLDKEAADALKKGNGIALVNIGEAMMTHGDYPKAIELIKTGLDKGISNAAEADIARLHLGISQLRGGDKAAAQATWATVKADNGAGALAQNWILISKLNK
jgi:tetratricopeptide (TPR) repeat protein